MTCPMNEIVRNIGGNLTVQSVTRAARSITALQALTAALHMAVETSSHGTAVALTHHQRADTAIINVFSISHKLHSIWYHGAVDAGGLCCNVK